ncbi:hypothetical protein [Dyella sp.]|uniref:hypothetical protein n=1 Tax=Dyella sp. TaxID=1869338 RepID=UPI002851EE35|nr:hypothetical protein [Dyella sp.]MDR3446663.1 hypothetical protein [Dyella sp.]
MKSKAQRRATWILTNVFLIAMLYLGIFQGSDGATRVFVFYTWARCVYSWFFLSDDIVRTMQSNGAPVAPAWLANSTSTLLVGTLLWHGWTWCALATFVTAIFAERLYTRLPEAVAAEASA